MPFLADAALDATLSYLADNGDRVDYCSQEPTTYAEATSTYTLMTDALMAGTAGADYDLADGDASGRKLTMAARSGLTATASGDVTAGPSPTAPPCSSPRGPSPPSPSRAGRPTTSPPSTSTSSATRPPSNDGPRPHPHGRLQTVYRRHDSAAFTTAADAPAPARPTTSGPRPPACQPSETSPRPTAPSRPRRPVPPTCAVPGRHGGPRRVGSAPTGPARRRVHGDLPRRRPPPPPPPMTETTSGWPPSPTGPRTSRAGRSCPALLMPTLARACSHPGCPDPARRGAHTCAPHTDRGHEPAAPRASAAARGYGPKWRRIRAQFLRKHPLCVECGRPATEVDHVTPLALGGTHEWANLKPLCKPDHSRKTARENREASGRIAPRTDGGRGQRKPGPHDPRDRGGSEISARSGIQPFFQP